MLENDKTKKTNPEDVVEYTAPLMPWRTDRDIFVAVNGESIRIKRGETVQIKRKFVEVIEHAEAQEMEAYRNKLAYQQQAKNAMTNF